MTFKTGTPAPNFTLPTDGGSTITLSSLKGKTVVVYFYPKDCTSGCTVEAQDFRDFKDQFDALGAVIIGISKDSVKSHDNFKSKENLNFILASDEDTSVHQAYGVWAEKSMYGKKYFGANRSTFLIDGSGKIVRTWSNVKVPGHVAEVLSTLKDMQ